MRFNSDVLLVFEPAQNEASLYRQTPADSTLVVPFLIHSNDFSQLPTLVSINGDVIEHLAGSERK